MFAGFQAVTQTDENKSNKVRNNRCAIRTICEYIYMNNELLNEVASLLNTTDKNLVISATLKNLIELGMTVKEAWETVFCQGSYNELAGNIYDSLKAA